jgi:acetyl esterase/lipase
MVLRREDSTRRTLSGDSCRVGSAGLICRYGYYGDLAPSGDMPPILVVHGEKDILASVSGARAFVERVRAVSSRPVIYAELPGAHHDFGRPGRRGNLARTR